MSTPPIPPVPGAPLKDTSTLTAGDVVQIAVKLQDKITGQDFWWKRFAVVVSKHVGFARPGQGHRLLRRFTALTLKMHPDFDKDLREIDLSEEDVIVTKLEPERYPQGVVAMRLKALALGWVKIGEG